MSDPLPLLRLSPLFSDSVLDETVRLLQGSGVLLEEAERQFRKRWIEQSLELHKGNQLHVATALGMHRNTLGREIARLKIRALDFKAGRGPGPRRPQSEDAAAWPVDAAALPPPTVEKALLPKGSVRRMLRARARYLRPESAIQ